MTKVEDIRQSENWSKYLSYLGWKPLETNKGCLAEYRNTPLGKIVKIQRPDNIDCSDVKSIENTLKKILFIKVESLHQNNLNSCGFKECATPLLPPSTIFIDLEKSEKELRENLSRSAKYATNKAEREKINIEINPFPTDDQLKGFHNALKKTGRDNKFYVQPIDDLKKKRDVFEKESFLVTATSNKSGFIGGIFYLGYEKSIWSIHVATGKIDKANKGNYLLIWKAIMYFKHLGYKTMDMEGAKDDRFPSFTKRWGGFTEFKRRFGGEIVTFPKPQIKIYSKLIKALDLLPTIKV